METRLFSQRLATRLPKYICTSCRQVAHQQRPQVSSQHTFKRLKSDRFRSNTQVHALTGYYSDMLSTPQPATIPPKDIKLMPTTPTTILPSSKERQLAQTTALFGDRDLSAKERRRLIEERTTEVAGIKIPPRPEEPDNCCMSGCVNCVWDLYREEYEEWSAQSKAAKKAIAMAEMQAARKSQGTEGEGAEPDHVVYSMDDDGGGSDSNWDEGGFADIPVGIREFMRTEKLLKMNKMKQQQASAV